MRNCLLYNASVLLFCLLISTTAKSQPQKIYLHPKSASSAKQSQFVDSLRFVPLEIKEGIHTGAYSNVVVTEKYFLLIDYSAKTILLYSKSGGFVKKINFKRLGENFYPSYHERSNQIVFFGNNKNYALTPKDQIKVKLDWDNSRNRKYFKKYTIDLSDTLFTIRKDIPSEKDIVRSYHFYDEYYMQGQIITSPLFKDSLDYEFKIFKNSQLVKSFFPYNRINDPRFLYTTETTILNKTDTPYIHFITRPFCDTIYKLVKDSLFPAYQLVLPLENSLPPTFFTNTFKNKTERNNFERNNGWLFNQVYSFYETSQFILFSVSYFFNHETYMYHKQTNITYKAKNIKPDSSHYNLQMLADFNVLRKGDKFYKLQKAGDIIAFFAQNKNVAVPKELENFLNSKPHSTTPVIVEFKLKN